MRQRPRWRLKDAPTAAIFCFFMHQNGRSFLYTHWSLLCRSQNVYAMYADINWYQIELFISRNICSFFSLWLYKFLSVLTKKKVRNTRKIDTELNTEKIVQNTFRKIRIEPGILRTTDRWIKDGYTKIWLPDRRRYCTYVCIETVKLPLPPVCREPRSHVLFFMHWSGLPKISLHKMHTHVNIPFSQESYEYLIFLLQGK